MTVPELMSFCLAIKGGEAEIPAGTIVQNYYGSPDKPGGAKTLRP